MAAAPSSRVESSPNHASNAKPRTRSPHDPVRLRGDDDSPACVDDDARTLGYGQVVGQLLLIAIPFAFVMARVVPPRWRGVLVALVLVPLWASYLVKAYAWRAVLQPGSGVLDSWFGGTPGYGFVGVVATLTYLWLPYMVLAVYAGFERLPESHLEASTDLGASFTTTARRVILPALLPSIAAGSVFTFSLSLGDYLAVSIVGGKLQVLGTAILQNITLDQPFAAALVLAFVHVPLLVVGVNSFNADGTFAWPPTGWTTRWWAAAASAEGPREALWMSIRAGVIATGIALVLGTLLALAMTRLDFFGKQAINILVVLPIALPGIVTGVALESAMTNWVTPWFGLSPGPATIVIGHATICVVVLVLASLLPVWLAQRIGGPDAADSRF